MTSKTQGHAGDCFVKEPQRTVLDDLPKHDPRKESTMNQG